MSKPLIAGIETGGTKVLARLASLEGELVAQGRWPTSTADQAADDLVRFLADMPSGATLVAVGLAAFGPLVIDPGDPDQGRMLATPKPGWAASNLRSVIERRIGVPVAVDTDVNAAAIAEQAIGAGQGLSSLAYVTVGTGIGAGLAIGGTSLKGALHPEAGHLSLVRLPGDEAPSQCPFHADCAEGLVGGPAVRQRLGGASLADAPEIRDCVASYLGQLGAALVLTWSPQRIVWGGGVIAATPMAPLILRRLNEALGGYGVGEAVKKPGFCVEAALDDPGLEGAMIMARQLAGGAAAPR